MPVLTLKFKDTKINEYRLQEGGNLTIGRRDANNIVIENLAVSGFHAKIDSIDSGSEQPGGLNPKVRHDRRHSRHRW